MRHIHKQRMCNAWNKGFDVRGVHESANRFTSVAINQTSFFMRIMSIQSLCFSTKVVKRIS